MTSRDPHEKLYPGMARTASSAGTDDGSQLQQPIAELQILQRPTGLRGLYYNPVTQVVLLGFVCFMCPGLFNSLNGLGGGGQLKESTNANANSALYATFAVAAFFAGCVFRRGIVESRGLRQQLLGRSTTSWAPR